MLVDITLRIVAMPLREFRVILNRISVSCLLKIFRFIHSVYQVKLSMEISYKHINISYTCTYSLYIVNSYIYVYVKFAICKFN